MEEKIVQRSLFTTQWKRLVGRPRHRWKISTSYIRCDVADGIHLAQGAYKCNGYPVSFPGVRRPGRGVNHPPPSSAKVKETVELYLHSPSGASWPLLGTTYLLDGLWHRL
jgi:hypothetical protein